jgi:hypothetical protein
MESGKLAFLPEKLQSIMPSTRSIQQQEVVDDIGTKLFVIVASFHGNLPLLFRI